MPERTNATTSYTHFRTGHTGACYHSDSTTYRYPDAYARPYGCSQPGGDGRTFPYAGAYRYGNAGTHSRANT